MIDKVINVSLISNPINWVIVILMVLLGGIILDTIISQGRTE